MMGSIYCEGSAYCSEWSASADCCMVALTTNAGARTVSFGASDRLSALALSAPSESGIGTALELTRPTGKEKSLEFEG